LKQTHVHRILILPDAGQDNPFQYLIAVFLKNHGFQISIGKKRKLGSIFRAVHDFNPEMVYFDWVHGFIIGRSLFRSCFKSLSFVAEVCYLSSIRQIPIIHTLHNTHNHAGLRLRLEQLIYGFFLKRCTKIRVYSEAVKRTAIDTFGIPAERISVIQDPPYHFYYENITSSTECRVHLNIPETDFVFLFFGKIKPYKGLENLIQSFLSVAKPDACLLIAGESLNLQYLEELKKLSYSHPRILWFDRFIAKHEVQYFFNAADVIVLPFVSIDHSGSIDLAMSFSKPVITLRTGATLALLPHQAFLLFETGGDLTKTLERARKSDLKAIGRKNFMIADHTNYHELLTLFGNV
jgi:beta-1,4-mannosyltransferase